MSTELHKPHAALVIIGHGSTLNPDSSSPTHQHAEAIRQRGIFAEVACAFWKEEPSMSEVYAMLDSREVYLVPNFISEGYFCQQVLPRELRVTGPVTQLEDRTLYYCDPVGVHRNMTKLLLQRADEVAPGVPRDQTSLIIVGHGTNLNENSTKAIKDQVALIRERHGFAEVIDAYMEEAPLVNDWHTLTTSPNVVVVPFFISDGLHSFQDIPVLLGMEAEVGAAASQRDVFRHNPHHLHGRNLYYSSAIGTEPHLADVILDQVIDFDARHHPAPVEPGPPRIVAWLESKLAAGELRIDQVLVRRDEKGFVLCHADDDGLLDEATWHEGHEAAREVATLDDAGDFRPLKSAPNLRHDWALKVADAKALRLALDHLYPAALGLAINAEQGTLQPVPLRENLGRQTGMYRFTNTITDNQAMDMIATCCDTQTKCQRRITWGLTQEQPLYGPALAKTEPSAGDVPLLCIEVCPLVVAQARKVAQANHAAKAAQA